jgi:SAM-dependent methyltransferase
MTDHRATSQHAAHDAARDHSVVDWADARERLTAAARDDASWYDSLATALAEPTDTLALDVGCGGAGMARALAMAMPAAAKVLALDATPEIVDAARTNLADAGVDSARADVVQCDLETGLDGLRRVVPNPADVIWASAVVHHIGDQQGAVDALAHLLSAGGRLALAEGGLRIRHLPWDVGIGAPGLELRLDAAQDAWFGHMRAALPGTIPMPYGWTEALRRAGLVDVASRSTLLEKPPPLATHDAGRVIAGLAARVDRLRQTDLMTSADLSTWDRLLDPVDDAWLGHRGDLYSLEVRTVHVGRRARTP